MIQPPSITHGPAQPAAVVRLTIPRAEIRSVMGPAHAELISVLAAQGVAPTGPWFTHHLRMHPDVFDFEVGVPVAAPVVDAGRVTAGELPAATVARTTLHGGYEGLGAAWGQLDAWIRAEGHMPAPGLWERYVAGPESSADPAAWRTELNRPLSM
jgi:effector-binding domain-containing protein